MRAVSTQSGRSLTELLIVLAITGVMAAMASPTYQMLVARAQARSVAGEVASTLRMARQLAMARRERLLVRFDLAEGTVTLQRADVEGVLDVYRYGEKGVAIEEPTAGPDILFHSSGRSASATTIRIQDRQGRRTTVTVSLTGRVVIS
jgi:type IV fimbrial biogenesis protein FimT